MVGREKGKGKEIGFGLVEFRIVKLAYLLEDWGKIARRKKISAPLEGTGLLKKEKGGKPFLTRLWQRNRSLTYANQSC